jgi:Pilus formation protein N terminal region
MFQRIRSRGRRSLAAALTILIGLPFHAAADESLMVALDEARIMRLPERVATLIIGNPLIADAALQSSGVMVLTGKGYGATNLIALDRSGAVLLERTIEVRGPRQTVVVYRGVERHTYSCAPWCERRIVPGDTGPFFGEALGQTLTRAGAASTAGVPQPEQDREKKN